MGLYLLTRAIKESAMAQQQVADSSSDRRRVGVALCGFGRAGSIHFKGLRMNHRCILKYVVEDPRMADKVQAALATYNLDSVTKVVGMNEYQSVVLADPEVHAVVVATPTFTHEDYVRKALEAKKAVFCEKPIAGNTKDVASCYDAAAKVNRPLFCAFNRRFDPGMSKIQQQVKEGKIGQIYQIKTTSRDSPRPSIDYIKISTGMYHDCGVHDIDMVCWIVGEEPVGVMAAGVCFDPEVKAIGDIDTVAIILKFPSGILATIDLNRHSNYGYDQRLEVLGKKGMLVCENPSVDSVHCYNTEGSTSSPLYYSFPQRYELAYRCELDHFIDVVLDPSKSLLVTREQTLLASRVANACIKSQEEGRMVELEPALPPA